MTILQSIKTAIDAAAERHPKSQLLIGLGNESCCQLARELAALGYTVDGDTVNIGMLEVLSLLNEGIELYGHWCKYSMLLDEEDIAVSPRKVQWLPLEAK